MTPDLTANMSSGTVSALWLYASYSVLSVAMTIWVARTLAKHGTLFLVEVFGEREKADAVNHLLVVGFYLVNLGFVTLNLKHHRARDLASAVDVVELLASQVGTVLVVLGAMHFFNLYVFSRIRRAARLRAAEVPPVLPNAWVQRDAPVAAAVRV